jgi:hypothetical protein
MHRFRNGESLEFPVKTIVGMHRFRNGESLEFPVKTTVGRY